MYGTLYQEDFTTFEYKEGANCEISALEHGYYQTILPPGSFKVETRDGYCHISFSEKSMIKKKKISTLKVELGYKHESAEYRNNIHPSFVSGKLQVTNDNVHIVKRYVVRVPRIANKDNLKHDAKIYDWYDESSETVIIFKEIPARISSISGQEIIWV